MAKISNFSGIVSNADFGDVPAGAAQFQKNINTNKPGIITPRKGIQPASFGSSTNIATGYSTFQRMCFCKTRTGEVIGVNGINRGFIWDGVSNSTHVLGVDAPANGPTIAMSFINELSGANAIDPKDTTGEYLITDTGHGLTTGDKILIGEVEGTGAIKPELNGNKFTVTVTTANAFYLDNTTMDGTQTQDTGQWSVDGQGATSGSYLCAYRYKTSDDIPVYSAISTETLPVAQTADKFSWSNITASTNSRVSKIELWRTTAGQFKTLYKVAEIDNGTTTYEDTKDDDTLALQTGDNVMDIIGEDGTLIARRQVPPPDHFAYCVMFQDRYFYFSPVKYNKGTCGTGGVSSSTLSGAGTDWPANFVGRYIEIEGQSESIKITAHTSGTNITLEKAVTVAAGKKYVIYPDRNTRRQVLFSYQDEPESVPPNNSFTLQSNHNDDAEIIGAMPYGPYLYILAKRFKYSLSYGTTPLRDGNLRFLDDRGAFNHYCWDVFENRAYLMDDSGAYEFDGSTSETISKQIQDIWRKDGSIGSIDYTKSDKFFVKTDRPSERIYFFVSFVGDSGTYPRRALVYNIRRKSWDMMEYPVQISSAGTVESSGEPKTILSSENEGVYLLDAGNTDIVTSETKGTATSSTSSSLVDSGASWGTNAFRNASVYIYQGTGKGQRRTIASNNGTTLNITPNWTTNPDTTSKYSVGAVQWEWKSGSYAFPEAEGRAKREFSMKFRPTDTDTAVDLRIYYNGSDDPVSYEMAQDLGGAVEIQDEHKEDVVFNIGKNFSELEESTGREKFRFDGMYSTLATGEHKVAFEIRGHSATEKPEIQLIEIEGVSGPSTSAGDS